MSKQDKLNDKMVQGLKSLFPEQEAIKAQQKAVQFRVSELERQAAGTTRANGEVAKLRKELEAVTAEIAGGDVNDSVLAHLNNLDSRSTALYLQVADHGDRILAIENSKIDLAHKSEIETVTPWGQAFAWGAVGAILGLLLFGVVASVENSWIGVLSFGLIGLFVSAFVLTKLNLRLQIEAQHDWAKKQPPVVVESEIEEPTSQWWASDQANK